MSGIAKLRISARLILVFGSILILLMAGVGFGVWRIQQLATTARALGTLENRKLVLAYLWQAGVELNWVRARFCLHRWTVTGRNRDSTSTFML